MANAYIEFTIEGLGTQATLELDDSMTEAVLGRSSDCQLVMPSGSVSRRHARVVRQGSDFLIEDLGSSNGTFVNGTRVESLQPLHDQDEVKLGSLIGRFVSPPPEPASDATVALTPEVMATVLVLPSAPPPTHAPRSAAPPPPPPIARGTPPSGTATTQMPEQQAPAAAPPPFVPASAPTEAPPAPAARQATRGATHDRGPSVVELAAIAVGSFLVVFVIGAAVIRFLL